MQVETDRSGTELAAFAGAGLALLGGVLPWLSGRRPLPPAAVAVLLLGAAAGGALLYGGWRPADRVAVLGIGATVAALALGAHGRYAGGGVRSGEPGVGLFVAGVAGLVLAGAGARGCWACDAVTGAASDAGSGAESESESGTGPTSRSGAGHRPASEPGARADGAD